MSIKTETNRTVQRAEGWFISLTVWMSQPLRERRDERDRGDVPGWVMITVMTAISQP